MINNKIMNGLTTKKKKNTSFEKEKKNEKYTALRRRKQHIVIDKQKYFVDHLSHHISSCTHKHKHQNM